jgi:hypothetical protein
MSTADTPSDSPDEKVSDDIAAAFDAAHDDVDEPTALVLEDTDGTVLRREKDGMPVARVYDCPTYDCKAYYAVKDEQTHFYNKSKGYAIDDSILFELEENGVEKVFIGLKAEKTVLEFNLPQYLNYEDGEKFNHGFGDQRVTPKDNAVREWPNAVGSVEPDE